MKFSFLIINYVIIMEKKIFIFPRPILCGRLSAAGLWLLWCHMAGTYPAAGIPPDGDSVHRPSPHRPSLLTVTLMVPISGHLFPLLFKNPTFYISSKLTAGPK